MSEEQEEKFSEDPMEHFKIENEILKMKLKAQFGDAFQMFASGENLPPDIENQFLKNMIQFEENYQNAEFITIGEKIGNPTFKLAKEIAPEDLRKEIDNVLALLATHQIQVDFMYEPLDEPEVYQFLTEEFLGKEIEKQTVEGAFCNFLYEEFKPNHREDLNALTHQFVLAWVTKNIEDVQQHLAKDLMDDKGITYKESDIIKKVENFFTAFECFQNDGFNIDDISFKLDDDEESGFGHGEGALKFEAVLENGEIILYEGAYKIYFTYQFGYWYIFYFVMPGFNWSAT